MTGLVVNLLAFLTGAVLYAMLVFLVWRERAAEGTPLWSRRGRLPLWTGLAGLIWNAGGLVAYGLAGWWGHPAPAWLNALIFTALGTLPAFIVHALFDGRERVAGAGITRAVTGAAYGIAACAGLLHFMAAWAGDPVPTRLAVWILTAGYISVTVLVLLVTRGGAVGRGSVWVAALSVFAVSSLHFEQQHTGVQTWWVELLGHHASLPLALAILHQDYRFAFADLFLKNALAWLGMVGVSATVFFVGLVPLVGWQDSTGAIDPRAVVLAMVLLTATAMSLPFLRRGTDRLVDRAVLRRPDYADTLRTLGHDLDAATTEPDVQSAVTRSLAGTIGATDVRWLTDPVPASDLRLLIPGQAARAYGADCVALLRPDTVDPPRVALALGALRGGRRLLSDDVRWLEDVARMVARRMDGMRVADARRLTTEAELRALRAQINPHFLFNALTTIGYLIRTSPDRALETLLKLTDVLRSVLRQSHVDFVTLDDELRLVESYLDIEVARFEERLQVVLDVADDARACLVPPFLLQPLVENAVKHGIAPLKRGGTITLRAHRDTDRLHLEVSDTGAGVDTTAGDVSRGVGLSNVERRLGAHYGDRATLTFSSTAGQGTRVHLMLPIAAAATQE
jgi:two-component system LytT family sensor kinase